MNGELDPNAVAAEFLKQNLDALCDSAKNVIKGASDKIRLNLDSTYRSYLSTLFEKYSKAKSFLLRGEAVPLHDFYVPLDLAAKKTRICAPGITDVLKLASNMIVIGSAGCGKSMLVRYLLLDALLTKTRVPVFVELRQFNLFEGDLMQLIAKNLAAYKFTMDDSYIRKAIEVGHFVVFLDGYDEVAHDRRQAVRTLIREFVKLYDRNAVILTSRPDPELEGWNSFLLSQVSPLSLPQARALVEKLPFDDILKERFLVDLQMDLFHKHESFLSNPLLLSIMLLSYGQSASIPNKLSVFYNQAYEALFERHDVLKDGFKRRLLTPLDIQDFSRLFAAFCIQTYDKRKIEFSHTEALECIEASQNITGLLCEKEAYLQDLIQAVCLLVQDGLQIVFAHRSFQEYFAARFISHATPEVQKQLIHKYTLNILRDGVLTMLHEMRPDVVERHYIIPGLDDLFATIRVKRSIGISHYKRFVRASCSRFILNPEHVGIICDGGKWHLLELTGFTIRRCGDMLRDKQPLDHNNEKAVSKKWMKILDETEIDITKSPHAHDFMRDLAKAGGSVSIRTLQDLFEIRTALKRKAVLQEKSLESILRKI